jgi:hypothetical protein
LAKAKAMMIATKTKVGGTVRRKQTMMMTKAKAMTMAMAMTLGLTREQAAMMKVVVPSYLKPFVVRKLGLQQRMSSRSWTS